MRVGKLEVLPVLDGHGTMSVAETYRYVGTADDPWAPHQQFATGDGTFEVPVGGFVVATGGRVVLVDTGVGDLQRPPWFGGQLLTNLAAHGFAAEDVTDVVFTHLHFDHVGWATRKGAVVFPNATYRCHRADWTHFVDDGDGATARKFAPVLDRMEFWEADTTIAAGVDVTGAPGHTPGSTIVVVSDGGEQALLLGDVAHCPFELIDDDWEKLMDVDPALARQTRIALAREYEGKDVPIGASHFPGMEFGRLLPGVGTRSWRF